MEKTHTPAGVMRGQRLHVLFIENDSADLELCLRSLEKAGFELQYDAVQTLEAFAECVRSNSYDVILADYNLTGWTGLEALPLLRQLGPDIPFILVTGSLGEEIAVECIKQGATDYVLKDRLVQLPVAIQRALEETALRAQRARAVEQLAASEARFRTIFEAEPECVSIVAPDGTLLDINPAGLAMLEAESREQVLNKTLDKFVGLEFRDRFRTQQRRALEGHEGELVFEMIGLKGARRWLETHTAPLRDPRGGIAAVLGVTRDITEQRMVQEMLLASEERYRLLFERNLAGVYRGVIEDRLLDCNEAFAHIFGYASRDALLSHGGFDADWTDSSGRLYLDRLKAEGSLTNCELSAKRQDGKSLCLLANATLLEDEHGQPTLIEGTVVDITDQRLAEAQFRQAQKFEAIGQLAGGIAHDFNNMIGAIVGWADLGLDEATADGRSHNYFRKIRQQADRATALTRQLLAFARRQLLEPRSININETVTEVVNLLGKLLGSDVDVQLRLAANLRVVRADPTQVEQVLTNLCVNARDAMPSGGQLLIETENVAIDEEYCSFHSYAKPGLYAKLAVSDTGVGMDAATLERIFEPFFTTKEPGKGTGLGLATVYGIVKQHGGFLHVYSEPGIGTIFRIYLPAGIGPAEKIEKPDAEPPHGGAETILVVEDHEGLREIACETLGRLGYQVLHASNGEQAIELFRGHRERVALVLLDVVLPKMSGPEVYSRMCALRPDLPAVFVSGYSAEHVQLSTLQQRGVGVLQKPYTPASLARKIREALDRRPSTVAGT